MKNRFRSLLLCFLAAWLACDPASALATRASQTARGADTALTADFAVHTGVPLFKRQNTFSPSHSFVGDYAREFVRDAPLLRTLRSESQRVDLFMGNGGIGGAIGLGSADRISYSYMAADAMFKQFYKNGALPYIVYFATPNALYDRTAASGNYWKFPPSDMNKWAQVCENISAHYAALGWPLAANEVWNEPDWFDHSVNDMAFYGGTWEEYLEIYRHAARGIRAGNPHATVGGLSLATFTAAYENGKVKQFLDFSRENDLPLDFISYHCYVPANYPVYTRQANAALSAQGDAFNTTGLHLNEFHISMSSDVTATAKCVSPMLDAIAYFVETPQITSVNWACFRVSGEQGIQMIESRTGKRYAAYHLLSMYNDMPVERVALSIEGGGIRGFASADDARGGVMLYNRSYKEKSFSLRLNNLPFARCDLAVYAIDGEHSNYGANGGDDEADVVYTAENVRTDDLSLYGAIASGGAIYVKITDADGSPAPAPVTALVDGRAINGGVATVLKKEYYFADRLSTGFSEFDLGTFTAYAGTGNLQNGLSMGSAVMTNLPSAVRLRPEVLAPGRADAPCFLAIERLDGAGECLEARLYTSGAVNESLLPPRFSDCSRGALPLGGELILNANEGTIWRVTYGLTDAPTDTTLKIAIGKE